jgi:uncharacterized protein YndB with AHSA1/START domain
MGNTVTLHRVVKAPPASVYKAFTVAAAMSKWISPRGFTCTVHSMDAKVGGSFRMSFVNFDNGQSHSFGGTYLEMIPHEKLRYSDRFDDPNLPDEMIVTVLLKENRCGCDLNITQENIPDMIPLEMCYLGWQDSLNQLLDLVETAPPSA